jgi:membrane protein YdbS with pleckstrin-like domain
MSYQSLNLDPDEKVILEVRKHWIVFIGNIISFIFFTCLPFIVYTVISVLNIPLLNFLLHGELRFILLVFYILWLLGSWVTFFIQWTNYYLDVWYVTEKRIIDIDQKQLFHREVSNLRFDHIQDVTLEVRGIIATFLDFGDIRVQTAAEDSQDFFLKYVAHPEEVKRIIFAQHNKAGNISEEKGEI